MLEHIGMIANRLTDERFRTWSDNCGLTKSPCNKQIATIAQDISY